MRKLNLALVQMGSVLGDVEGNLAEAERLIRRAAACGAQLICLPEAFSTGYDCHSVGELARLAQPLDGPTVTKLRRLAAGLGVYLVAPIIEAAEQGSARNTSVLIGDRGELAGSHSKTHLVGDEVGCFERGNQYQVFETQYGKVGLLICYEVCFPEPARMLALQGAELILVSAAWRHLSYYRSWLINSLTARALENVLYVGAACMTGDRLPHSPFTGSSMVVSPIGEILQMAGEREAAVILQEVDLDRIEAERAENTVLQDRHPQDYSPLCSPMHQR